MVDYAFRPADLDGCWQTWREQDQPVVIRTQMDDSTPKVRLRFTGLYRIADVSVTLKSSLLPSFMQWFRLDCQGGVKPTNMIEPDGTESIWRFVTPPVVQWAEPGTKAVTITCQIERLPGWQEL